MAEEPGAAGRLPATRDNLQPPRRQFRRWLLITGLPLTAVLFIAGLGLILALAGKPVACGSGDRRGFGLTELRSAVDNLRNIRSIRNRVNFPEQVVTIAAEEYDQRRGDRFDNLKVGFCDGHAEASATWPFLSGVHVQASADLRVGEDGLLYYHVTAGRVGSLPGWISTWLVRRFDGTGRIDLKRKLVEVEVEEGSITLVTD